MSPSRANQVLTATFERTVARPQRLTLQAPVRYRTKGLGHWHQGIVENLSHSGVLLSGPEQLAEHTLVEMVLYMPEQISGQQNSMVLCQCRIIRHMQACKMAASILDYKILPARSSAKACPTKETYSLDGRPSPHHKVQNQGNHREDQ
jgi:hypothetical protein